MTGLYTKHLQQAKEHDPRTYRTQMDRFELGGIRAVAAIDSENCGGGYAETCIRLRAAEARRGRT